ILALHQLGLTVLRAQVAVVAAPEQHHHPAEKRGEPAEPRQEAQGVGISNQITDAQSDDAGGDVEPRQTFVHGAGKAHRATRYYGAAPPAPCMDYCSITGPVTGRAACAFGSGLLRPYAYVGACRRPTARPHCGVFAHKCAPPGGERPLCMEWRAGAPEPSARYPVPPTVRLSTFRV